MTIPSDQVRVPAVSAGVAAAVRRYDKERAFVLHPDDFHRLTALEDLAATVLELPLIELSAAAIDAHREETGPETSVTDPVALKALLGE